MQIYQVYSGENVLFQSHLFILATVQSSYGTLLVEADCLFRADYHTLMCRKIG